MVRSMRYTIPAIDKPNPDLMRSIIEDWLEVHPEDQFCSGDPDITFLLHNHFPSHLCDTAEQFWIGFWGGWFPGDVEPEAEEPPITLAVQDGKIVLDEATLDALYQALLPRLMERFSGLERPTPTGSTPDA